MTLRELLNEEAPGWTVRRLAARLGYSEAGLYKIWRDNPARVDLWVSGLKLESIKAQIRA